MSFTCPRIHRIGIQTRRCGTTSSIRNSRDTKPRRKPRSKTWPNGSLPPCPRTRGSFGASISGAVLQIYCLEPYVVGEQVVGTRYWDEDGYLSLERPFAIVQ